MPHQAHQALAVIRGQPWAIMPAYLDAIEALALRVMEHPALLQLAADGHAQSHALSVQAVAATGARLDGTRMTTIRDGVAVLPVLGPIFPRASMISASANGTGIDAIMADLRAVEASPAVSSIVMLYDTPGGIVSGLAEAAAGIRASAKPITAFVTGMAASAGYWLASQANEIVTEAAGMVGSIGVMATVSRQEALGPDGRREYQIISSGAPNKVPDPSSDAGRAEMQAFVDAAEAVFINDVARGRRVPEATVRRDFGRGGMLVGSDAVRAGMADRIGTLDALLTQLARRTGPTPSAGRRIAAERDYDLRQRRAKET